MKKFSNIMYLLITLVALVACGGTAQFDSGQSDSAQTGNTDPVVSAGTSISLGGPVGTTTQQNMTSTGSKVTPSEANEFLEHHNMARNEVGVADMAWSKEVAAVAQRYAEELATNCDFQHSGNSAYGENLFMGGGTVFTALDGSKSWYTEKADYTYNNSSYDHYTQMIWNTTTAVGVGVAICPNGNYIVVANYAPAGNMVGEYPY